MSRSFAVIGSGAIGCYYGGLLAKSGREVHFLFHSDYEQAATEGLRMDSVDGDYHIKVNAYNDTKKMPKCDVVIVSLKTTSNHLIPSLITPILKPDSVVMMIQNGYGLEHDLAEQMPPALKIIGWMAFICSTKIAPAHVSHIDYGALTMGSYQNVSEELLNSIASDLSEAAIDVHIAHDLNTARWKKLVWNIPYNGLCALTNKLTSELMSAPDTRALLLELMNEVISGARACGAEIRDAFADDMMSSTEKMKPYKPSMMVDRQSGRRMELKYIYQRPIEEAAARGVDMPRAKELLAALQEINV